MQEVRKHHDEWSDEEIPNSQRPPSSKASSASSRISKKITTTAPARKCDENPKLPRGSKKRQSLKVAWPPKKGKTTDDQDERRGDLEVTGATTNVQRSAFPDSGES